MEMKMEKGDVLYRRDNMEPYVITEVHDLWVAIINYLGDAFKVEKKKCQLIFSAAL